MTSAIDSATCGSFNQNFKKAQPTVTIPETSVEIRIDENELQKTQLLSMLSPVCNKISETITDFSNYVNSVNLANASLQSLIPPEELLDNYSNYLKIIDEYGQDLVAKLKGATQLVDSNSNRELWQLVKQLKSACELEFATGIALSSNMPLQTNLQGSLPMTFNAQRGDCQKRLTTVQEDINQRWTLALNYCSTIDKPLTTTAQSVNQSEDSGGVNYKYQTGSGSDASLVLLLLFATLTIMENSYRTAVIESQRGEMLNDKLNSVTALNQFLSTLDSFYQSAIEGYNNLDDDNHATNFNFDDKEIADASGNSKSGFDEKVVYSNGKNTWYVSADELPEESLAYFDVAKDGSIMVTSSGIQDYVKYVSDSVAVVIPGYGSETNIYSIFTDSALESAQITSFETGLNNVIQQIQSLQSSAMSNATSDIDNADSAAKFFDDIMAQYNKLFQ